MIRPRSFFRPMQDSDEFENCNTVGYGDVQGSFGAEHGNLDSGVSSFDNLFRNSYKFIADHEAKRELGWRNRRVGNAFSRLFERTDHDVLGFDFLDEFD